eukprot:scaffold48888_cov55-Phaeocystis_antarctica.AAC.3
MPTCTQYGFKRIQCYNLPVRSALPPFPSVGESSAGTARRLALRAAEEARGSARKHLRQLLVGDHSPHRDRRRLAPQGAPRAGPLLDQLYGECSAEQDHHVVDRHLG